MRVVFMGTPDIASVCLKKLIADGFDVSPGCGLRQQSVVAAC